MVREKRWDVDVEGYDLLDLSMSHSCVCARTHGCYSVRRYRQHPPAMKEWGEKITASSERQEEQTDEEV